ncbi:MAG: anti-sigma factor antagonist [Planctomycetes bacterium]|nr:anti-sigma factor antagonist [Planctomycetota bacterium]
MANIEFRVKVIKSPSGITATLAEMDGSIDASTIQQFQQVMDKLIEKGVKNLILDCTNVKYINSTGLGTLLKYADTFESIGGHIAFCRVPSKVMLVMEMLGFNALFNIVPDEATALKSFSGKLAPPASVKVQTTPAAPAYAPPAPPSYAPPAPAAPPAAAPPAASFPMQTACARCRVTLDVPKIGKYKCPRCGAVLAVEPTGRVRFFASKKGRPIEISIPSKKELVPGISALAASCASAAGFDNGSTDSISSAVQSACDNLIDHAYGGDPGNVVHMLIVPNGTTLTIKIADHGKALDFGPSGSIHSDSRFAAVVSSMDTVEHRPNPRGGNMITLIKVMQQ